MTKSVDTFIGDIMNNAESSYEREVPLVLRLLHSVRPTRIFLSPSLYARLKEEHHIVNGNGHIRIGSLDIYESQNELDCVVDMHSHYPMGYNSSNYGLKYAESFQGFSSRSQCSDFAFSGLTEASLSEK